MNHEHPEPEYLEGDGPMETHEIDHARDARINASMDRFDAAIAGIKAAQAVSAALHMDRTPAKLADDLTFEPDSTRCPHCGTALISTHQEAEPDCGVRESWSLECPSCDFSRDDDPPTDEDGWPLHRRH